MRTQTNKTHQYTIHNQWKGMEIKSGPIQMAKINQKYMGSANEGN